MTEQQDVLETRRPKRRALGLVLLGMIPLAVAGTAGAAASAFVPTPAQTPVALPATVTVDKPASTDLAPVIAPGSATAVDLEVEVPQITVSIPPPPEPEPELAPVSPQASGSSGSSQSSGSSGSTGSSTQKSSGSTSTKSSGSSSSEPAPKPAPQQTADSYCSAPSSPYAAGGSAKGLLTAANKERARIGAGALSWSGSLASAATSWSQTMASKDTASNGGALAHNPNRPGAENVAVSGSSGGMSVGSAVARAHNGWMYSYGHCVNIMNPAYSSMGAGTASTADGKVVYTTANFR
ncbi:CAP domain-containing protein [Demequina activiva]|uniref:SCP domain-containing protein n=1 Tax=Demequina activiva TaxID=1582364 RepID=A0A919Q3M8_9MICO|nr:CAP domain-containing protein [Demequina activiva]GIG53703.1 hypothetical protein Dac01nite_04550 [Demequina activiva]